MFESLNRKIAAAQRRAEEERKAAKPLTDQQFESIDYTARKKHEDQMRDLEAMRRQFRAFLSKTSKPTKGDL